jgi:hypothetical protein
MYFIKRITSLDLARLPFKGSQPETAEQVAVYDSTIEDPSQRTFRVNVIDLAESLDIAINEKGVASFYFTDNNVITSLPVAGTFYKIEGSTIQGPITRGFSVGQNNFVRTGPDGDFKISTTLTVDDGAGSIYGVRYRIFPFDAPSFNCPQCLGTGQIPPQGAEQSFSVQATLPLRQGDGVEVWITKFGSPGNALVKHFNTIIHSI